MKRILIILPILYCCYVFAIYWEQEFLIFQPQTLPDNYKFEFSTPHSELSLKAEDGSTVSAVMFPPARECAAELGRVLFIHGNAASIINWEGRARDFTSRCWGALLVDYRPFGKSRGVVSEAGVVMDVRAAYDHLRIEVPPERIVIYGLSLGTGLAVQLGAAVENKAVILEAPYLSMLSLAQELHPITPVSLILRYPLRSDLHIAQIRSPVLILHGDGDSLIPIHQGEALAKLGGDNVYFVGIKGAGHWDVPAFAQYDFELDRVLGAKNST